MSSFGGNLGHSKKSHVQPSEIEAANKTEVYLYFEEKSKDPAHKYVYHRQHLEWKSDVACYEWNECV